MNVSGPDRRERRVVHLEEARDTRLAGDAPAAIRWSSASIRAASESRAACGARR